MRVYNTQALRWLLPMDEPFSDLEAQVLSEMYDAEVAYQDHLLAEFLEILNSPYNRENTAVIVVSDHGEMLGEHQLMGHSFRVYQELVHVPMFVRYPGQELGERVCEVISTRQIFHTVLDLAGIEDYAVDKREGVESHGERIEKLSLQRSGRGATETGQMVFSEAIPPENVLKILDQRSPEMIGRFNCRSIYRAAYDQDETKLVRADDVGDEIFLLQDDPAELAPGNYEVDCDQGGNLYDAMEDFLEGSEKRRPDKWTRDKVRLSDEKVAQRLRALGYME
jgi:uncharacterized sulfatase